MLNIKDFSEMFADELQGVLLLTPSEIEKIIGKKAYKSFNEGILSPMLKEECSDTEIMSEFVDIFIRQYGLLDKEEQERYIKTSLERGKNNLLKNKLSKELVGFAEEVELNDVNYIKNLDKIESFCKKNKQKYKKIIDEKVVQEIQKQPVYDLIYNKEYLNSIVDNYF